MSKGNQNVSDDHAELEVLKTKIAAQEAIIANLNFRLGERKKEMWCQNEVTRLVNIPGITPEELCRQMAKILPLSMQFPELAHCEIKLYDEVFHSDGFKSTDHEYRTNVSWNDSNAGIVRICYSDSPVFDNIDFFLPEEFELLDAVGKRIALFSEKYLSERLLYSMAEASPDVITITDLEGKIEYSSPKAIQMFGGTPGESYVGRSLMEFIDPSDHAKAMDNIGLLVNGNLLGADEYLAVRADGSQFPIEVNGDFVRNEHGLPVRMIFITRDITRRKKSEEEVVQSERRYRLIAENTYDGILVLDGEGRMIYVSPSYKKMYGYGAEEEVVFDLETVLKNIHPEESGALLAMIKGEVDKNTEQLSYTYRARHREGYYLWFEDNTHFRYDESGKAIQSTIVSRNVTERKSVEIALRKSEEKYRSLIESSDSAIMTLNPEGRYTYLNPIAARPYGVTPEALTGASVYDLFPKEQADSMLRDITMILKTNTGIERETEVDLAGQQNYFRVSMQPVRNESGTPFNVMMLAANITETKVAEKKLLESEKNYRTLFVNSPDAYLIIRDGIFIECNKAAESLINGQRDQIIGKTPADVSPEYQPDGTKSSDLANHIIADCFEKGHSSFEWTHRRFDGSTFLAQIDLSVMEYLGSLVLFTIWRDITDQRLAEEQVRKLSRAVEQSPVSIVITNPAGNIEYANPCACESTGYTLEELIGNNPRILKSGETKDHEYQKLWHNISQGREWRGIFHNRRKNGELYWESSTIAPIIDLNGKITHYVAIKEDITDRKKAEQEIRDLNMNLEKRITDRTRELENSNTDLLRARIEADKANMAKSEFLSRMSHELRTPMNSILGFAQLLEMGALNPGQHNSVRHILKSGRHLLELINEVLDLSRIEAGRLSLSIEPVYLFGVLRELTDSLQPLASSRNIQMTLTGSDDHTIHVKADRQRLKQVLLNILNNGIKYNNDQGSLTIAVQQVKHPGDINPWIRISVTDTGIGIAAEDKERIFVPFERIGADQSNTEGTGLGLAVVKKLTEAMGGMVGVESTYGLGSTFWIDMPQIDSQIETLEKSGAVTLPENQTSDQIGTILYVEDNVSNIELVQQILLSQRQGINLITELYGNHALKRAIETRPDLILLDLNLPDVHGGEVLELLLNNPKTKEIPVVIISADAMPHQLMKMLKAGARHYLTKPLDIPELLKVIDQFIHRSS